jgi:hypothetical protein
MLINTFFCETSSQLFMSKIDPMVSYLNRRIEGLVAIGTKVEDQELVFISLKGVAPSWMPFV